MQLTACTTMEQHTGFKASAASSLMGIVEGAVRAAGIPQCGVCRFADALPLLECRAAARLPQNAASIIVCILPYYTGEHTPRNLARYAVVPDYHRVAGELLRKAADALSAQFSGYTFAAFTDSSPIREVHAAYLAGLGFVGKNGQLITPKYGSYCFIGELVTDLALPAAQPVLDSCNGCGACVADCPAGALESGSFAFERCLSHITQKKGALTPQETELVQYGGLVWGCDRCTDCCPHNAAPRSTPIAEFYAEPVSMLTEANCRALCKTRAFGFRGASVPLRNLALLAGNSPDC